MVCNRCINFLSFLCRIHFIGILQIHCSFEPASSRLGASESEGHVCFTIPRALLPDLQAKLLEFSKSGNEAACSAPYRGTQAQEMGMETMDRFFLRVSDGLFCHASHRHPLSSYSTSANFGTSKDFAGNRLEIGAED